MRYPDYAGHLKMGAAIRQVSYDAAEGAFRKFDKCGFEYAPPAYRSLFHASDLGRQLLKIIKRVAESQIRF